LTLVEEKRRRKETAKERLKTICELKVKFSFEPIYIDTTEFEYGFVLFLTIYIYIYIYRHTHTHIQSYPVQ